MSDVRPTYHEPSINYDYDENGWIPCTPTAGWDIAFGCRLNFGWTAEGRLEISVHVSDHEKRNGIACRSAEPHQLEAFADQLRIVARAGLTPLQAHLASEHALTNAQTFNDAEGREIHEHEHHGPGTIRDHDENSLHFDAVKAVSVIREGLEP